MACCSAFTWLGVALLAYLAVKAVQFANMYFFMRTDLNKYKKVGGWAVVTGASDGIGKALATELARRGFNVCLISRTKAKLDEVAKEIQEKAQVQTRTIAFDFSTAGNDEYAKLFKELDQIPIGVLVNNVGINYEYPMEIDEADIALELSILKVNCESQVRMTKYVVPRMKEKRAGAILNLSSTSCRCATPMLATYGASKAYNMQLSEALAVELKPYGIDVTAVTPSFVCSNMSGRSRPTFDCPSAKAFAVNTINQLGGVSLTFGHRHHGIMGAVMNALPKFWLDSYVLKANKAVKVRALKKKARAAEAK